MNKNLDNAYFLYLLKDGRISGYRIKVNNKSQFIINVYSNDNRTNKKIVVNSINILKKIEKTIHFDNVEQCIEDIERYLFVRRKVLEFNKEKNSKKNLE